MTCQTCQSPHHRATECAATSDRTLLYVSAAEADALRAEVARLRDLINLDRTGLAAALNEIRALIHGYAWIGAGEWGSYDYEQHTTDTLRDEWRNFAGSAMAVVIRALRESGQRADAAFRLTPPAVAADALFAAAKNIRERLSGHKPATREASHASRPVTPGTDSSGAGRAIGDTCDGASAKSRLAISTIAGSGDASGQATATLTPTPESVECMCVARPVEESQSGRSPAPAGCSNCANCACKSAAKEDR